MTVLVTGATGFIGSSLVQRLIADKRLSVRASARRRPATLPESVEWYPCDLVEPMNWRDALTGVHAVVHLAARVHIMRDTAGDPLAEFRRVNTQATLELARQASSAGVRRFIYVSSVKVNGEEGSFTEEHQPAPEDPYAISKHEAEVGLRSIAAGTGLEVVIVRPPLVYGPGVGANFGALIRAVRRGIPLPLGAVHNRRSLVAVDNLVDFLTICLEHPEAANQTFFVSDGEDLSTRDLIVRLGAAMGGRTWLLPVPTPILSGIAALLGRHDMARRLLGTLRVDISKAHNRLYWSPPLSVDEGLRRTVAGPR